MMSAVVNQTFQDRTKPEGREIEREVSKLRKQKERKMKGKGIDLDILEEQTKIYADKQINS